MFFSKKFLLLGLYLASFSMFSTQASAERLFATVTALYNTSILIEIDPATGIQIGGDIGDVGYEVGAMAYDATTDTLFAVTRRDTSVLHGVVGRLLSINMVTGAGTLIGSDPGAQFGPLAVNLSGELWGVEADPQGTYLILWDKVTGTFVRKSGSGFYQYGNYLAFDLNTDALYAVKFDGIEMGAINITGGSHKILGNITGLGIYGVKAGGDFSPESHLFYGLSKRSDEVEFAERQRELIVVNAGIREVVEIIGTKNYVNALAFVPDPAVGLGECDGIVGINIQDVICTIDEVLN